MIQTIDLHKYNNLTSKSNLFNIESTNIENVVQKIILIKKENISETIKISSCCKVTVRPNTNAIVLAFSVIGMPKGKFSMSQVLSNYEASIIYLNCPNSNWYLNGVEGLGNNISTTLCSLRKIVDAINSSNNSILVTTGASMGGYGAILYGCLLDAKLAVCAGVETQLLIEGGVSIHRLNQNFTTDSIALFNKNFFKIISKSSTKCFIYYGDNCYSDLLCGLKAKYFDNVNITSLKNLDHPVSAYINTKYGWDNFLKHHIVNNCEFLFKANERSNMLQYPKLVEIIYQAKYLNLRDFEVESFITILNSYLEKTDDYISSHVYNTLSLLNSKLERPSLAYKSSKKAVVLNKNNIAFNLELAKFAFDRQQYKKAIFLCDRTIALHNLSFGLICWEGFILKAKILQIFKKHNESLAILQDLVENELPILYLAKVYDELHHLYKQNLVDKDRISSLIAKFRDKYFDRPDFKREILKYTSNINMENTINLNKQNFFIASSNLIQNNLKTDNSKDLKRHCVFFLVKEIKKAPNKAVLYWNLAKLISGKKFDISDTEIAEIKKLKDYSDDKTLNKLVDYSIENAEIRKSNHFFLSNYNCKVVSLGSNCLPRTVPTRWGLKYPKSMGELSHPFDLSVHFYDAICQLINNDFEDYLNPLFLKHDRNKIPANTKYNVHFNHEKGNDFLKNNYSELIKRYQSRIDNFYQCINKFPVLFVHVNHKNETIFPSKLARIVKEKFLDLHHKILYINIGQSNFNLHDRVFPENMIVKHIPYPNEEYIWHHPKSYISEAGKKFELAIINSIKQAIIEHFPSKTMSISNIYQNNNSLKVDYTNNLSSLYQDRLERGNKLKDKSMFSEAIANYQEAIKLKPNNIQPLLLLGQIYETQKNWSEAAKCYRQTIDLNPRQINTYIKLSKVLKIQNQDSEAIATYQKAIEIEPDNGIIYAELARTLMAQQNIKEAVVNFQKAIALQPKQPAWVYHGFADVLNHDGQIEDAIAAYQKAIEIAPNNSVLQNKLQAANLKKQSQSKQSNQNKPDIQPNTKLKVTRGKNNWLFLDNDNNQINKQLSGEKVFSDRELFKWKLLLEQREALLEKYNISYFFLVIPNKACVYPEYLPDSIKVSDRRCINQLISYLADNSFAKITYPLEILKQAKARDLPIYRLRDTHWTALGSFITYQYIMSKISQTYKTYILPESSIEFSQVTTQMCDLGSKLNINEDILIESKILNSSSRCVFTNQVKRNGNLMIFENTNRSLPKAVIFGDSFSTQLIKFFAESFSRMVFVWQPNLDYSIILNEKPDIVISEQIERFLVKIPGDLNGYSNQERVDLKRKLT